MSHINAISLQLRQKYDCMVYLHLSGYFNAAFRVLEILGIKINKFYTEQWVSRQCQDLSSNTLQLGGLQYTFCGDTKLDF